MEKYTKSKERTPPPPSGRRIELVVPEGLEPMARRELRSLGRSARVAAEGAPGVLRMSYDGELRTLLGLRLVTSVYLVRSFPVPRPKALLGDEHFRAAVALCESAMRLHPTGSFRTMFLSAAGADTAVLGRFKQDLSSRLGLTVGAEDGDLLLRLRRSLQGEGWDLLVRLSPRPLATRPWRVCNLEGALNGPVAHALALLTEPAGGDIYLNVGCGSGTLLVERLTIGPARRAIGCDTSATALSCARSNLDAAGFGGRCELHSWDGRALPLADASVDVISADLPFGHLVGSHAENLTLYPALLAEAARVARPGARAALLSHEVRLMEGLLRETSTWELLSATRVDVGGLYPRMFSLRRASKA